MGSFTTKHVFADSKELSYKATPLKNALEEIRDLGIDFTTFMKKEMENENGELVEAINQEIIDQHRNHNLILDYCEDTITSMTNTYTDYVNDMRKQDVTLYYKFVSYVENS
ncbi:hypothetical protein FS935_00200 [Metabacillus litoralis]|uniref:Uncharacterized protein n=1 Tax=Metabacillus litoralis TaxID=152268 RepID=A0A5C6W882_9BACI|nr:hypothetical protein [Metabacillus litoralis]TXC92670.1 hypothetical protein FS935_00200 [Metabacillus litoralis]